MKKTTLSIALLAGAFGVLAFTPKLAAANSPMPGCPMPSCCGGLPQPLAQTNTHAMPDLLKTCPVSGDKLDGDMGKPFVFTYKNQEVKLCCKDCKAKFDKNPDKYLKLIRAADKK